MPRPKRTPATPSTPVGNTIIASAAQLGRGPAGKPGGTLKAQQWQSEAWYFAETNGELAYAVQWVSNALSLVRLRIMEDVTADGETTEVEVTTGPAVDTLNTLFDGEVGQGQMMGALGTYLEVPGEGYLVGVPPRDGDPSGTDNWRVLSNEECKQEGSSWVINRGDGIEERYAVGDDTTPPGAVVIRIWWPSRRRWAEATSPVRSALPILREHEGLSKHIDASIDSRLAGAGLLIVPSEMTFGSPTDVGDIPDGADPFLVTLAQTMAQALKDPHSPAAKVPILLKAPASVLASIQHLTFDTPLSERAIELRDVATRRLALAMNMPPEILMGQADSNHWSAWVITEEAIKVHITPIVNLITEALTTRFLWPALSGDPMTEAGDDVRRYRIDGDTSALRQRADQSANALVLHDRMAISDAALLRETQFDSGDAPAEEEVRVRLLRKVAESAGTDPAAALAALRALGVQLEVPTPPAPSAAPGAPATPAVEAPPAVDGNRTPPAPEQSAALMAAAEPVVTRALERAHARLGMARRKVKPVTDTLALDSALADAWVLVPRVAALLGLDAHRVQSACEAYVRGTLTAGASHDPIRLARHLTAVTGSPVPALGGDRG